MRISKQSDRLFMKTNLQLLQTARTLFVGAVLECDSAVFEKENPSLSEMLVLVLVISGLK